MLIKSSNLSVNSATSEAPQIRPAAMMGLMVERKETVVLTSYLLTSFLLIYWWQVFSESGVSKFLSIWLAFVQWQDTCYYWTQAVESGRTSRYGQTQKSMIVFQGLDHFWQLEKETFNQIISHSHPSGFGCFFIMHLSVCVHVSMQSNFDNSGKHKWTIKVEGRYRKSQSGKNSTTRGHTESQTSQLINQKPPSLGRIYNPE